MKNSKDFKFSNWFIIIMVVINVSALSSFIIAKFTEKKPLVDDPYVQVERMLVDQIGFDQEQLSIYNEIKEKYDREVSDIRIKMHEAMDGMLAEVAKRLPDTAAINRHSYHFGNYQAALKTRTMEHFIQLRQLAKPGQEMRFEELFGQLQHRQRRRMGRGQGQGKGRGMGYGNPQWRDQQLQQDSSSWQPPRDK
jgi:Spy/CpxP family protein refolding chaperone